MTNKMSRRQRAKARQEERQKEDKSLFLNINNNSNAGLDFFSQLLYAYTTDSKIVELIERNAVLSTSIDLVATCISALDLNLYRRQKTGDFVPVKGVRHIDHTLSKPNPNLTKTNFIYEIMQNLLAFGHVYVIKANKQYYVFQPREITVDCRDGTIVGYTINAIQKTVDPSQVCHIFKPALNRKAYTSPVKSVISEVLLNSDIIKQVTTHVRSGMMAKGVLKQDSSGTSALSQNQMDALAKAFTAATSGERSTGTIMLPKGITYETFASTVADAALVETFGLTRKQIIQAFKIPESIYTAEATSFASANVQEVTFMKNALKPWCVLIQDAFNNWPALTSETEYYQFEMGDLVSQEEEKFKAETTQIKANTAMIISQLSVNGKRISSPNEVREAAGLGKITDESGALVESADDNPFNAVSEDTTDEVTDEPLDEQEGDPVSSKALEVTHKKGTCSHG